MKRQGLMIVSVLLAAVLLAVTPTRAGRLYFHCQQARRCCSIPRHHYGHEIPRSGATAFAVANAAVGEESLRHKPFHFRALALTVDHLTLDQVGLAIYKSDGRLIATGRIAHGGGDGGLIGNNVIIRVRAFVAPSAELNPILPLETEYRFDRKRGW